MNSVTSVLKEQSEEVTEDNRRLRANYKRMEDKVRAATLIAKLASKRSSSEYNSDIPPVTYPNMDTSDWVVCSSLIHLSLHSTQQEKKTFKNYGGKWVKSTLLFLS